MKVPKKEQTSSKKRVSTVLATGTAKQSVGGESVLAKQPTLPKKVAAKKTAKVKKSSVKALVVDKPSVKKRPKTTKKTNHKSLPEEAVEIPTNMSLRAIDKAGAWSEFYETVLPRIIYNVSYTSAFCFIVVGAALCSFSLVAPNLQTAQLHSALNTATSGSTVTTASSPNSLITAGARPTVTLLEPIPTKLTKDARLALSTNGVGSLSVHAESITTAQKTQLSLETTSNTHYRMVIPFSTLAPGDYVVRALVATPTGGHSFRLGSFSISSSIPTAVTAPVTETIQAESIVTLDSASDGNLPQTTSERAESDKEAPDKLAEVVATTLTENTPVPTETRISEPSFTVTTPTIEVTGWVPVRITAPNDFTNIELFIRPQQSLSERFLGQAAQSYDRWFYTFNSENVPNGRYTIVAKTTQNGREYISAPAVIQINNTILTLNTNARVDVATTSGARSFLTFEQTPTRDRVVSDDAAEVVEAVLLADTDRINALMKRYAVALQTNDPILIAAFKRELRELREQLLVEPLTNQRTADIATAVAHAMEERFIEIKRRVDAFEIIRVGRDGDALDSDGDGISDSDEILVYGTDPFNPDTDGDGILDGIEIIRGFDPLSIDVEAVINYEIPREVAGLERPDVLRVTSVTPFVERGEARASTVLAEIRGTAIPNAFVTLYIFSTPTIVTVKTDADGSFVYRFERELEDGAHEVYVAFTDNTGAILAQSEPFGFIKQAEAFTSTNATTLNADANLAIPDMVAQSSYNLVFGLSIISFGLILLLLGISIRPKPETDESAVASV